MSYSLFPLAEQCLVCSDPDTKLRLTDQVAEQWQAGEIKIIPEADLNLVLEAGRPETPNLVPNFNLPKRTIASEKNHPVFIHALCHIEFNAINLAWDAVYRFRQMPRDFYSDWIKVAREEAYHFRLLRDYLRLMNSDYGTYDAHGGLWEMAIQTAHDPLVRMALVPRVLEARGLDVTPGMIERFRHHGKDRAAEILEIIYADEVGHVEIGTRWYHYLCNQRGLDADKVFEELVEKYAKQRIRAPLNDEARKRAGFNAAEMAYLYSCL
jgi:uncharacterized ferritin-like protein (DUF455 family)